MNEFLKGIIERITLLNVKTFYTSYSNSGNKYIDQYNRIDNLQKVIK